MSKVLEALENLVLNASDPRHYKPALEKLGGAFLSCWLVMTAGFVWETTLTHLAVATVTGIVSAAVVFALVRLMPFYDDSVQRRVTLATVATFVGDVVSHESHWGPTWAEAAVTAAVAAVIAFGVWNLKAWAKNRF